MKKIKVLRVRNQRSNSQADSKFQSSHDGSMPDAEQTISKEIVKKRPVKINSSGFTSWIRKIRPTSEGMESEVEEPLIIVNSGHRVKESEILGQCDICGGYDSHICNCDVYGCKKSLCLKHVYFFEHAEKKVPYCLQHYRQVVDEFDTWQRFENRRR